MEAAEQIETERLLLVPLALSDAGEMVGVLADRALYEFTGGDPPSLADLESRYRAQVAGPAGSGEVWHNWIVRLRPGKQAVGFVQATVTGESADVAWVVGAEYQGRGIAAEAGMAMCGWLVGSGIRHIVAHVHPGHTASQRVAAAVGLAPSGATDDGGEDIWSASFAAP